eukprot:3182473-Lingulodinium_polyedra.AAC.1
MGRLQCYVDDPLVSARGSPASVRRAFLVVVLFWLVCVFELAWNKGSAASTAVWAGACLAAGP